MYAILRIAGDSTTTLGWTLMKFKTEIPFSEGLVDKRAFTDAKVIATKGDVCINNYEIRHPRNKPIFIFESFLNNGVVSLFKARYSIFEIRDYLTVDDDESAKLAFEVYDG